jgi:hypothetical protein
MSLRLETFLQFEMLSLKECPMKAFILEFHNAFFAFVFDNHRTTTQTTHIDLHDDFMGNILGFPSPPRHNKESNVSKNNT